MSAVFETSLNFRPITEQDLEAIMQIETRAYQFPWKKNIFLDCSRVGYECWLLEEDNVMIAYGIMIVAAGECHILNLCVDPHRQNQGYGNMMLEFLLDIAKQKNTDTAFLEVRPSNKHAIQLYQNIGFDEVGIRKNYYPAVNDREDALIFAKNLI